MMPGVVATCPRVHVFSVSDGTGSNGEVRSESSRDGGEYIFSGSILNVTSVGYFDIYSM